MDKIKCEVTKNIEMLQQTGHGAEDLFEIVEKSFLNKVINTLQPDAELFHAVVALKNNPSEQETFMNFLKKVNGKNESIRFHPTKKLIKKILDDLSLLEFFKAEVNKIPDNIDEIGKEKMDVWKKKDEYKLPDWIGIN